MLDNGREYVLVVDVPGATQDGLEVKPGPVAGTLSIRVEAKTTDMRGTPLLTERGGTAHDGLRYQRVVPVGWDADVAKAKTTVTNGVMVVHVPRVQQAQSEKK